MMASTEPRHVRRRLIVQVKSGGLFLENAFHFALNVDLTCWGNHLVKRIQRAENCFIFADSSSEWFPLRSRIAVCWWVWPSHLELKNVVLSAPLTPHLSHSITKVPICFDINYNVSKHKTLSTSLFSSQPGAVLCDMLLCWELFWDSNGIKMT